MKDEKTLEDEALRAISDAEENQAKAQQEATEIARTMQASSDDARVARELVKNVKLPPETLKSLSGVWQRQSDSARAAHRQLGEIRLMVQSSANIASFGTSTSAVTSISFGLLKKALIHFPEVRRSAEAVHREPLLAKLRAGIIRCVLDNDRPENRSVLALIEEAESAVSVTASPTGTLIALRGAILQAFANLLRRGEGQERAKSWKQKVQAVERLCGSVAVPPSHFQVLADQAERISDDLSDAKVLKIGREEVLLRYTNGLQFLLGILDGVDEARLRP